MNSKTVLLAILAVFAPIKPVILAALVLTTVDLLLGVMAAKKRSEPITSNGLRRTITKLFIYETAILCAFLTETYLIGPLLPILKIVTALIGVAELKSILENLDVLNGGSFFNTVIEKLNGPRIDK